MAVVAGMALLPAWLNQLPVGYSGFFVQMAEQLAENGLVVPREVAFYGPGGTPFAYPPFGIYLMAVASGSLGVPIMAYVRWFPGLFSVVLTVALTLLARRLVGDRWVAAAAVVLIMTNRAILDYHTTVAGVVRGPALAFAIGGLWATLSLIRRPRLAPGWLGAATGLFALTLLSHLSYAVFLFVSLVVFAWLGETRLPVRSRVAALAVILVGGVALASPWWITVVHHWGLAPFASAGGSHGGFGALTAAASQGLQLPRWAGSSVVSTLERWSPAVVPGLAVAGFGLLMVRRQWLIPAWGAATYFGIGESERYLALVGGVAAAVLLGALAGGELPERSRRLRVLAALPAVLVVGLCLVIGVHGRFRTTTALSPELLETATWLAARTPPDARYLELTGDHDIGEWLPYLTRRTPVVAPWGSEWNGRRARQLQLNRMVLECVGSQRGDLVDGLLDLPDVNPDVLVVPTSLSQLVDHLEGVDWVPLCRNTRFVVLGREPQPSATGPAGAS